MRRNHRRFSPPKSSLHHHEFTDPAPHARGGVLGSRAVSCPRVGPPFEGRQGQRISSLWHYSDCAFTGYVTQRWALPTWRSIDARTFLPAPFSPFFQRNIFSYFFLEYLFWNDALSARAKGCGAIIRKEQVPPFSLFSTIDSSFSLCFGKDSY